MKAQVLDRDQLLSRIAKHVILNASLLDEFGLCFGKMGIVIFLYHLSRHINNNLINEFANELLTEVINGLPDKLSLNFSTGYSGIGWAFEYLIYNQFVEAEDNIETLSEIDYKIMECNLSRLNEYNLHDGLEGFLHYIAFRLFSSEKHFPFDSQYLNDLYPILDKIASLKKDNTLTKLSTEILLWRSSQKMRYEPKNLLIKLIQQEKGIAFTPSEMSLGLLNGSSGIG